jgi:hypothetical protein
MAPGLGSGNRATLSGGDFADGGGGIRFEQRSSQRLPFEQQLALIPEGRVTWIGQ